MHNNECTLYLTLIIFLKNIPSLMKKHIYNEMINCGVIYIEHQPTKT